MKIVKFVKKIHVLTIPFCMSLIFCLLACSTKQDAISNLSALVEEVQANGSNYSESDWRVIANELDAIECEMEQYKGEYTDEEIREIGRLKGVLLAQYSKCYVKSIKNGVENTIKEAEGVIDGFLNSFQNDNH